MAETAAASFAAIFACVSEGIAIAAITRITATTINNSMSENPPSLRPGCLWMCMRVMAIAPYANPRKEGVLLPSKTYHPTCQLEHGTGVTVKYPEVPGASGVM